MCDPISIAVGAAVVGGLVTGYGQIQQGNYANAMGKYEQKIAERNIKLTEAGREDARRRGEREQLNHWRRVSQAMGEQRAQYAAGNLDVNFGTPAEVVEDTLLIGMEDSSVLAENTKKEMEGFDIEAANYKEAGNAARSRGRAAKTASRFAAAGTILSTASQVAGMYAPKGSS